MKQYYLLTVFFCLSIYSIKAQVDKYPTNRLQLRDTVRFEGRAYTLARSSVIKDTATYNTYTQEYIPPGEGIDTFHNKMFIKIYTGNANMFDIANEKLNELQELKLTNPFVTFDKLNNKKTGELMIDFMTSENSPDGQYIDEAERSIYRYQVFQDTAGKDYVMLIAVCKRAEGDGVESFLSVHKAKNRIDLTKQFALLPLPAVVLPKEE